MAKKAKAVVAVVETNLEVAAEPTTELEIVTQTDSQVEEVVADQPSMLAGMLQQEVTPLEEVKVEEEVAKVQVVKNEGVGAFVRKLIAEGLTNTAILKIVHEQYGNKNTTYACVAWYRNKVKKAQQAKKESTAIETVEKFLEVKTEEVPTDGILEVEATNSAVG